MPTSSSTRTALLVGEVPVDGGAADSDRRTEVVEADTEEAAFGDEAGAGVEQLAGDAPPSSVRGGSALRCVDVCGHRLAPSRLWSGQLS